MSINVFLFDDEVFAIKEMRTRLKKYKNLNIYEYSSLCSFLDKGNDLIKPDIAFIDIQFGNETGFDVIKNINKINPKCLLVFVTNYSEYLKQGYEYRIYRYILKEEPEELIDKQISDTINEFYKSNKFIKTHTDKGDVIIKLDDIEYISIFNHTSVFHMTNGNEHEWNQSLNKLLKENLDEIFVRCHKGYIVNLKHIKEFKNKNKIIFEDNRTIEIGRAYKKDLFKQHDLYMEGSL